MKLAVMSAGQSIWPSRTARSLRVLPALVAKWSA
jgi:hypothetical protein